MSEQFVEAVLAAGLLVVVVLGFMQIAGPRLSYYRLSDTAIEVVLFRRFCIWQIRFREIGEIKPIFWIQILTTPALHLQNRPFAQYVLIRRVRGIFRYIFLTPDKPLRFIGSVQNKINELCAPR